MRELIFTLKKIKAGREGMIEHPPKVLASGEKAITSGCSARSQMSAEVHKEHSHLLKTCVLFHKQTLHEELA